MDYLQHFYHNQPLDHPKVCGFHSALIIGHRSVNNQTQFLLRNSWGTECKKYHSDTMGALKVGKHKLENGIVINL